MTGIRSPSEMAMLAAAALIVTSGIAVGQTRVPAREDGTWDWRHHEPVPSRVHRTERANGMAAPPASTDEVESLYRNLMRGEGAPAR